MNAMGEKQMRSSFLRTALASVVALCASGIAASAAWEPVRPVEFIVPAGTGAAKIVARMFEKSPCGFTSLTVMFPVASSVVIPEMSPFFVFENASAPTMFVKKPTPDESAMKSRLIAYAKSLAFTGAPFEYFKPERSVIVYVSPSAET